MGEIFLRLCLILVSFFQPLNQCSLCSHKVDNLLVVLAITSHLCRSSSSGHLNKLSIAQLLVIPAVTITVISE